MPCKIVAASELYQSEDSLCESAGPSDEKDLAALPQAVRCRNRGTLTLLSPPVFPATIRLVRAPCAQRMGVRGHAERRARSSPTPDAECCQKACLPSFLQSGLCVQPRPEIPAVACRFPAEEHSNRPVRGTVRASSALSGMAR